MICRLTFLPQMPSAGDGGARGGEVVGLPSTHVGSGNKLFDFGLSFPGLEVLQ